MATQMNEQEHKIKGWFAARNKNGILHIFQVEPRKLIDKGIWWDRDYMSIELSQDDFSELTWEDEPIEVELIIKKL